MLEEQSFLAWMHDGGTAHFLGSAGQLWDHFLPGALRKAAILPPSGGVGNVSGKSNRAPLGIMGLPSNVLSWKHLKRGGGCKCALLGEGEGRAGLWEQSYPAGLTMPLSSLLQGWK